MTKTNPNSGMLVCSHCEDDIAGEAVIKYTNDSDYVDETFILHPRCDKPFTMHRNGYTHECPKCVGEGSIYKMNPMSSAFTIISVPGAPDPNREVCMLCEGKGYLKKAPIPITKITEWKRDE